jgi:hypothetical protein
MVMRKANQYEGNLTTYKTGPAAHGATVKRAA